ncbi:MAG: LacI family DNA-binding transcriptional regulator [Streptosporangiales bacterium]|nr:LacI family DNA-binding transcriptional regulator [Streptosporangiales bacterium]
MGRPTIYSIAKACGVSASTVSRAFNKPHVISDAVRARILAVAAEMDYRPNPAARGLVTGRTDMLGLLVPDITNPFFPPIVRAIQQTAWEIGYSVLLVHADESTVAEPRLMRRLRGHVDGLILCSPRTPPKALREATEGIPTVLINRVLPGLPAVVCDDSTAFVEGGRHLQELGHRTVALLRGPAASWVAAQRANAVRGWAGESGTELIELGPFTASFDGGVTAAQALLDTPATAAFAFDDLMACGLLAELARHGLTVPGHTSVIGCDDVLLASTATPSLTTVTAMPEEIGATTVTLLRREITGATRAAKVVRYDGEFTVRASTGPPAPARVRR